MVSNAQNSSSWSNADNYYLRNKFGSDFKTSFKTREGTYKLVGRTDLSSRGGRDTRGTSSLLHANNAAAAANSSSSAAALKLSFINFPKCSPPGFSSSSASANNCDANGDRNCVIEFLAYNFVRELCVCPFRKNWTVDVTQATERKLYKSTYPTCHDFYPIFPCCLPEIKVASFNSPTAATTASAAASCNEKEEATEKEHSNDEGETDGSDATTEDGEAVSDTNGGGCSLMSLENVRLLIGFSSGQIQIISPLEKDSSKLLNEDCSIDKSAVTCIRWVPNCPGHFLVSHASGYLYLYNENLEVGGGTSCATANSTLPGGAAGNYSSSSCASSNMTAANQRNAAALANNHHYHHHHRTQNHHHQNTANSNHNNNNNGRHQNYSTLHHQHSSKLVPDLRSATLSHNNIGAFNANHPITSSSGTASGATTAAAGGVNQIASSPPPPVYETFKLVGGQFRVCTCRTKITRNPLYRWEFGDHISASSSTTATASATASSLDAASHTQSVAQHRASSSQHSVHSAASSSSSSSHQNAPSLSSSTSSSSSASSSATSSSSSINQFAFSNDVTAPPPHSSNPGNAGGLRLAVVTQSGELRVFQYHSMRLQSCARSYFGAFLCVAWSPDDRLLALGGQDDLVTVWCVAARAVLCRCQGHQSWVSCVRWDAYLSSSSSSSSATTMSCYATPPNATPPSVAASLSATTAGGGGGVRYRLGSIGQDAILCLWELSDAVFKQTPVASSSSSAVAVALLTLQVAPPTRCVSAAAAAAACNDDDNRDDATALTSSCVAAASAQPPASSQPISLPALPSSSASGGGGGIRLGHRLANSFGGLLGQNRSHTQHQKGATSLDLASSANQNHHQQQQTARRFFKSSSSSSTTTSSSNSASNSVVVRSNKIESASSSSTSTATLGQPANPSEDDWVPPFDWKQLGGRSCPRLDEVALLQPLLCKRVASDRLTDLHFHKHAIITACQQGVISSWARPEEPPSHPTNSSQNPSNSADSKV